MKDRSVFIFNESSRRPAWAAFLLSLAVVLWGCAETNAPASNSTSNSAAPSIATQPVSQTVASGQTATFTAAAAGSPTPTVQWQLSTDGGKTFSNISGATSTTLSFTASMPQNANEYRAVFTNSGGSATTAAATLTVNPVVAVGTDVTTYHNDVERTGQNTTETVLTQANVNSTTFGLLRNLTVDSGVDAEPLYLSQLSLGANKRNVVFIATENDSVYAFDADNGTQLWKASLLPVGSGETTAVPSDVSCSQVVPTLGITATPVIDRSAGPHGILYVVAMSKNPATSTFYQRLHALDVTTGAEMPGSPIAIQATYPGSSPNGSGVQLTFDPRQYKERAALLLLNGVIYTSWASHCDNNPYNGWIMAYDQATLTQKYVLNLTPNGVRGSVWQSGGGLAADPQGSIYAMLGNGDFDTTLASGFPNKQDYGNAIVKIAVSGGQLQVVDYFNMDNTISESGSDTDFGSGGPMVLPDQAFGTGGILHLAVGAGKDTNIYVVDRGNMGKFSSMTNMNAYQFLQGVLPNGVWGVPAYFNSTIYYCDQNNNLKAFPISAGKLVTPPTQTSTSFGYPGALPSISASSATDPKGIVWAIENNTSPAVLHAYAADDLTHELYSGQTPSGSNGNKFITPMIADGKVFVATTNSVAVFGLK